MPLANHQLKPFLGLLVSRIALFFGSKGSSMVIAPAVYYARPMLDVEHLMEQDVFDEPLGDVSGIQYFADGDGVMRRIVMAENAARGPLGPG